MAKSTLLGILLIVRLSFAFQEAQKETGVMQYALRAYADALEAIPIALAENAGEHFCFQLFARWDLGSGAECHRLPTLCVCVADQG